MARFQSQVLGMSAIRCRRAPCCSVLGRTSVVDGRLPGAQTTPGLSTRRIFGIGTRKIAVDRNALRFAPAGKPGAIVLELTRNQVRLAPQYKRGEPLVVVGTASGAPPARAAAVPERQP